MSICPKLNTYSQILRVERRNRNAERLSPPEVTTRIRRI